MKKIELKMALIGLGCACVMNALALSSPMFGNMPLFFEAVPAQADKPVQFVARGADCQFLISPAKTQLELQKTDAATGKISSRMVQMQFVGAALQAPIRGADELPGKVNYLIGNNPARWRTGIATFARVKVEQLYPGINLVYYGNQRQLEYDFSIAPGARPNTIKIRFGDVDKISIGAQGDLILALGRDEIRQPAPVIYQVIDGRRQAIRGGYRLVDANTVTFAVGNYNNKLPLVIDPVLSFSTYFGGSGSEAAWAIARDTNGFIYIAGQTTSGGLATSNAFQKNFAGGSLTGDAFVAKFDNQGSSLVYFTYLGGSADDSAASIAVDGAGDAFVTGFTDSTDFPTSTNAPYRNISGPPVFGGYFIDAFVAKLGPGGSNLVFSTYLGGAGMDAGTAIALDLSNNVYVTGYTSSTNFYTSSNAYQKNLGCPFSIYAAYVNANAFLTEISAAGTNLIYSSYFGGNNLDAGEGIFVDGSNCVYLTGFTDSTNFPTKNAAQPNFGGAINPVSSYDAFVAKFTPSTTNLDLLYSTFLGGTNSDLGYAISADTNGNAYVVGGTASPDFPNTTNIPGLYNGQSNNLVYGYGVTTNVFLTEITNAIGASAGIGFSTVFGGTNFGIDVGYGVARDSWGNLYVVGASSTTNFPVFNTPGLMSPINAGGNDVFVIAFSNNVSSVLYSGYLGGSGDDFGYGIAADSATNVFIAGQTASADFPTFNAYQSSLKGGSDAFLTRIGWINERPQIAVQPNTNQSVAVAAVVFLSAVATGTPPLTYQWQVQGTNLVWTNLVNSGGISGATNDTLIFSQAQITNSGSYRLTVANTAGSTNSLVARLTVTNAFPTITTQPTNQIVGVGGDSYGYAYFPVTVSGGTPPLAYQWMKDGTNLVDGGTNVSTNAVAPNHIYQATTNALVIVDPQTNDAGTYWLVITNPAGVVTSSTAILTVTEPPIITGQPTNQMVSLGSQVTFSVHGVGALPVGFQWQHDGTNLMDGLHISGSTNSTMTISNTQTGDNGNYLVIVTNSFGSATSSPPAVLTVLTAPLFIGVTAGSDGSFVFSGNGLKTGATYHVHVSTNLALPLAQWQDTLIQVIPVGSQGQFIFTNTPPANTPQRFYILVQPPP